MDPDGVIETDWDQIVDNFDDMKLKEKLLRGIYGYGFELPSAIQKRAIMPCILGRHVIAQAQSGIGKTATFSIAILQQIDTSTPECLALMATKRISLTQPMLKEHFTNILEQIKAKESLVGKYYLRVNCFLIYCFTFALSCFLGNIRFANVSGIVGRFVRLISMASIFVYRIVHWRIDGKFS